LKARSGNLKSGSLELMTFQELKVFRDSRSLIGHRDQKTLSFL